MAEHEASESEEILTPVTGATSEGVPLSFNRAPADDLLPWASRVMVAIAHNDHSTQLSGMLCNDAAYLRTAVASDWSVKTADGQLSIRDESFLCGQHSKAMPMDYTGDIQVAGIMLKPGAIRAIWGCDETPLVDRIKPVEYLGVPDASLTGLHYSGIDPHDWLAAMEQWLREQIALNEAEAPDELAQRFKQAAYADPSQSIADLADEWGITTRTLQRIVKRDFGLTPKQVMRRARTLDLATRLCGLGLEEEEAAADLRFFDQSHQIREFTAFFGMTPRQFVSKRRGLITLSLEIRQSRRLELLNRIDPAAIRPWMREPVVPADNRQQD